MVRVTEAGPDHVAVLAALHAAAFGTGWDARSLAALLAGPGVDALIAGEVGLVLVRTAADEAEILTIGVLPEQRRRGIGTALLAAAMRAAARRGAGALFLEVEEGNEGALALYRRAGFSVVGRRPDYYEPGRPALILRCALPHRAPRDGSPATAPDQLAAIAAAKSGAS